MQDFATPILIIVVNLMINPINSFLLISPFAFSVFYECRVKKFSTSDSTISTLSIFLLFAGIIFFLTGFGLTSPLFTANVSASETITTHVSFNNQNLPISNNSLGVVNGTNISILNISTTIEPTKTVFDFSMLGLSIGVLSLGLSLILSAISTILTIYKSYEDLNLNYSEWRIISTIWFIFGIIISLYGHSISGFESNLMKLFGIIYFDAGLLFILIFTYLIQSKLSFSQKISVVISQLSKPNHSTKTVKPVISHLRDHFNIFINNKKNMHSSPILPCIITVISLIFIGYGVLATIYPNILVTYLPQLIILEVGLGSLTWAGSTMWYQKKAESLPSDKKEPA